MFPILWGCCRGMRSVTCETGPSADLDVLQNLYDLLKAQAPATLVEDDSSWIGWNRIHDFWDDHTYSSTSHDVSYVCTTHPLLDTTWNSHHHYR